MSFEDDEYWEEEYSPRSSISYADNAAVARDRYAEPRDHQADPRDRYADSRDRYADPRDHYADRVDRYAEPAEPMPPARRPGRRPAGRREPEPGHDELAVRRQRRESGAPPRAPRRGFDTERPAWLDDPDFVPTDVSGPDLAGPDSAVLDFNRPELGANFDGPEFPSNGTSHRSGPRRAPVRPPEDDWDDEIDEPFDHRVGMDRRSSIQSLAPYGYDTPEDDWDDAPARPADDRRYPDEPRRRPAAHDRRDRDYEPEFDPGFDEPRRRPAQPVAGPPVTGRARVPQSPAGDVPEFDPRRFADAPEYDEFADIRPAASARAAYTEDDVLDVYRPPRDQRRADEPGRSDESRQRPAARAEGWDRGWADEQSEELGAPSADGRYDQGPARPDQDGVTVEGQATTAEVDGRPASPAVGDSPRVVSRAVPPATPKIISKAAPPAAPKVIKKAEPPAAPRVISAPPPVVPPVVAKPAKPGEPLAPAASAATAPHLRRDAAPHPGPSDRPDLESGPDQVDGRSPGGRAEPADRSFDLDARADLEQRADLGNRRVPQEGRRDLDQGPNLDRRPNLDPLPYLGERSDSADRFGVAARSEAAGLTADTAANPVIPPRHQAAAGRTDAAGRPDGRPSPSSGRVSMPAARGSAPVRPASVVSAPVSPASANPAPISPASAPVSPASGPQAGSAPAAATWAPRENPGQGGPPRAVSPAPSGSQSGDVWPGADAPPPVRPAGGRGPRVAAVGPGGPDAANSWQLNALPPTSRPTSMPPQGAPRTIDLRPGYPMATPSQPAASPQNGRSDVPAPAQQPGYSHGAPLPPESRGSRPADAAAQAATPVRQRPAPQPPQAPGQGARLSPGQGAGPQAAQGGGPRAATSRGSQSLAPHAMPTGQPDPGQWAGEPRRLPPTAAPAQVHHRVEPTAINGYPPTYTRGPSADVSVPHPAAPSPQPTSPAAPQANLSTPQAPSADKPAHTPVDPAPNPVGRISTSGPEAPRKYADADLGPTWFSAKPQSDSSAEPAGENAADHESAAASGATSAGNTEAAGRPSTGDGAAAGGVGLVLNLDLTGLLNGLPADRAILTPGPGAAHDVRTAPTAGQPPSATGTQTAAGGPAAHHAGVDAGPAQTGEAARSSLMPGPEPTEPKTPEVPVKPLAAADLAAIRWRLDGGSLREVVDDRDALRELGARLDEPLSQDADDITRSGLLSVRAEVYRLLGELGMAAAASRLALVHAESAGHQQSIVIAQAELAHVLRLRGDFAEADRLFEQAASSESPDTLRSVVHENAGRSCFDQGRHMEALDHFARAIRLGPVEDTDLVERIDVCLEAVYIHVLRDGWGPYPRMRRDILGPEPRSADAGRQRNG